MATRTWTGGGTTNNWSDAANWDAAITNLDDLVFAGSVRLTPNNDTAADTPYSSITFASGAGAFVISGNRITLAGNVVNNATTLQTINTPISLSSTRTINTAAGGITLGGIISGPLQGLVKIGAGVLTVSGVNVYTGTTTITAGTFRFGAKNNLSGTGTIILNGGSLDHTSAQTGANSIDNLLEIAADSTITSADGDDIDFTNVLWSNGILNLRNTGAGGHSVRFVVAGTTFTYGGEINIGTNCAFGANNIVNTVATYNGSITGSGVAGAGFVKNGGGTVIVNGNVTNTSGSNFNGTGAIYINGTVTNAVNLSAGTLGGTGTINGTVTCSGTAVIAPGAAGTGIGTLTISSVIFTATNPYSVNLSSTGPTADRITSSGAVTLAGVLTVASLSGTATIGQVFTIVSGNTISGTFSGRPNNSTFTAFGTTFQISYTTTVVTLTVTAVSSRRSRGFMLLFSR
jgi:autotransporter-associated beta strand protein